MINKKFLYLIAILIFITMLICVCCHFLKPKETYQNSHVYDTRLFTVRMNEPTLDKYYIKANKENFYRFFKITNVRGKFKQNRTVNINSKILMRHINIGDKKYTNAINSVKFTQPNTFMEFDLSTAPSYPLYKTNWFLNSFWVDFFLTDENNNIIPMNKGEFIEFDIKVWNEISEFELKQRERSSTLLKQRMNDVNNKHSNRIRPYY